MQFLHIPVHTHETEDHINSLNNADKVFVLFYMNGCGPCEKVRPQWQQLKYYFNDVNVNDNDDFQKNIVIADMNHELSHLVNSIKEKDIPEAFPSIRYLTKNGESEEYEGERNKEAIAEWIKKTIANTNSKLKEKEKENTMTEPMSILSNPLSSKTKKRKLKELFSLGTKRSRMNGGKWSLKYKRSIDCKRPRGFSQKQHCKYGKKMRKKRNKGRTHK